MNVERRKPVRGAKSKSKVQSSKQRIKFKTQNETCAGLGHLDLGLVLNFDL
jgi:hypothetical protein